MAGRRIGTILVPYDFSECATDALRVAAGIARRSGARIDVVHLYEQMTDFHTENMRLRDGIEARMEAVPRFPFLQGVELRKFMLRQMSLKEMFRNEHLARVDLIVMGTHGASGLKGLVGSNTQRVVRLASMPVLAVKNRVEEFAPRDVVYASNFTGADVERFDDLRPLIDLFDARLHLLKVNTPQRFERSDDTHRAMDAFVQRYGLERFTATVYNDLSVEQGILSFARTIDADLIAMATHGRTGLLQVMNGSLTEDIVNRTAFPVLSMRL
ncbi:MAG: universal stress protein [Flavobacteriales bacterium]|nr:universal stress protein [Flavobacteriales bacterium]